MADLKWERLPDMPVAVIMPAASVVGRRLVVTGGASMGDATGLTVQVLDLDRLTWSMPTRLVQPRFGHAQAVLADGRILVMGGQLRDASGRPKALDSVELIDAGLSRSVAAAPIPAAMSRPTAHLLPDGRVAVVGGTAAAVYQPRDGLWSKPVRLRESRREHASVLLADGSVLVGGGVGRSSFERVDLRVGASGLLPVRLPFALDDLAMVRLPGTGVWVLGGQKINGDTIDRSWVLDGVGAEPSIADGPRLGLPDGISDHLVALTTAGVVLVGGESQVSRRDVELGIAFRLDLATLGVQRLPDTDVAHDDAAAVVDGDSAIVLGGQLSGRVLGILVPTPVRAVHRLDLGSRIGARP